MVFTKNLKYVSIFFLYLLHHSSIEVDRFSWIFFSELPVLWGGIRITHKIYLLTVPQKQLWLLGARFSQIPEIKLQGALRPLLRHRIDLQLRLYFSLALVYLFSVAQDSCFASWVFFFLSVAICFIWLFAMDVQEEGSQIIFLRDCAFSHSQILFLCNQLICMAMTFVAPVISSDNGWACKADLKTYSLIMRC